MKTGQIDTATATATATAVATSINSSKEANAPLVNREPVAQPLPRAGDHAAVTLRSPSSTVLSLFPSAHPITTQKLMEAVKRIHSNAALKREISFSTLDNHFFRKEMELCFNKREVVKKLKELNRKNRSERGRGSAGTKNYTLSTTLEKTLSEPIVCDLHTLFHKMGIMKFDITGSSAEPIAIDPEHLPDDMHDIDIAAKVPDSWLKVDEKRSPSFRPIADRLADVLIELRPELKSLPKEARLIAYTRSHNSKKSAFKLTLNTVASSVPIDLFFYSLVSADFDAITSSVRLSVNTKATQQQAVLTRSISEKTEAWLRSKKLLWMNEALEGGLQRIHIQFNKHPDNQLLQPHLLKHLYTQATDMERGDFFYRLLTAPHFSSEDEGAWRALLVWLSQYSLKADDAEITPSFEASFQQVRSELCSLLKAKSATLNPEVVKTITPASLKQFRKALPTVYKQRETLEAGVRDILKHPDLHAALEPTVYDCFPSISVEKLIEAWQESEENRASIRPLLLTNASYNFLSDESLDPLLKMKIAMHLHHADGNAEEELATIKVLLDNVTGSSKAKKKRCAALYKRAVDVAKMALKRLASEENADVHAAVSILNALSQFDLAELYYYPVLEFLSGHTEWLKTAPQYYPLACFVDVQTAIKEVLELKSDPSRFNRTPSKNSNARYQYLELSSAMGAVDSALDAFHMTREKRAITPLPWGLVSPYVKRQEGRCGAVRIQQVGLFCGYVKGSKPSGEGVLRSDRYCNLVNRDPKSPLAHALERSEEAEVAAFLPIVIGAFKNDHQQVSTIVLSNGALYKGETLNGLPHGDGAWTLHNPQWPKTVQQAVLKLAPPTFKAKGYEYTLYGQFQHGILDVGSVTIPECQSGSKALERLELTFHKGRFRRAALVNYRDDKCKKLVIQCVEDGVDYNQAMLTNSKANAEVTGPYSVATRSIEGEGSFKMSDCECRINIKNNYGHGTGLLTYNNGVVAKVDVENGRIYDMLLHHLIVARILKNGFLKDYSSFNKVFSYKLPDPTEHQALFSCYNSKGLGVVGFWESRIIQAFVLKDERRDIKNQSPLLNAFSFSQVKFKYFGHSVLQPKPSLAILAKEYRMPEFMDLPFDIEVPSTNHKTDFQIIPHRLGQRMVTLTERFEKHYYFFGINLNAGGQRCRKLQAEPSMPEDTRAFTVERSLEPLLSNDDPVYYVESLFNLPNMDYLGGAYFYVSSLANKTLTIPHGRGLIYYQGVIVSDFQHGRLNGETNIILDNGSHLKGTFKEGCILEATMTFHNGVTVTPSFDRKNQYEGPALFCLPSGETIEAEFLDNRLIRSARIMDSPGRELGDMSALLERCGFDESDLYNFYFILKSLLEMVPIDLSGVSGKSDYCIIEEGVIEEGVIEEGAIEEGAIEEGVIEEGVIEEGVIEEEK